MRTYSAAVLTVVILQTWAGGLNAQTIELQREVDARLSLQRLGQAIRIVPSIRVLARYPIEALWDRLQGTAASLRRRYDLLRSPE